MDWNSINEGVIAVWAMVGTLGVVGIINVATFIKTAVSGKKFNKLSDFTVVADQSVKFGKNELVKAKDILVAETKKEIIEPLKQQVTALLSDNAQLASLTVSLLSYVPLPLEIKKPAVAVISKLGNITDEAKALITASLEYQEKQEAIEEAQGTTLQDDIDKI